MEGAAVPGRVQQALQGDAQVALHLRVRSQLDDVLQAGAAVRPQGHAAQLLPRPGRLPVRKGDGLGCRSSICKGHLHSPPQNPSQPSCTPATDEVAAVTWLTDNISGINYQSFWSS